VTVHAGTPKRLWTFTTLAVLGLWFAGCGGGSSTVDKRSTPPAPPARWEPFLHVPAVLDLTGPRSDGRLTVAADGRLALLGTDGRPAEFARGGDGYATAPGPEPYIALSTGRAVADAGCSFEPDTIYAIEPGDNPGVIAVDRQGHARRVASLPGVNPNGIAFDDVGRFGYRLLVTASAQRETTVFGVDCAGRVTTVAAHAPAVEGGIAVAPPSFGRFGGDLIAPDENTGQIWAIGPDAKAEVVARSPLPSGGDIGAESAGFVPAGFARDWSAYVADRRSPGNPHPGTDSILRLTGDRLLAARVRAGDLLVASEGGAQTIVVSCAATCTVRHVADGPAVSHVEGHVVFVAPR
jgi:hypothetical protein